MIYDERDVNYFLGVPVVALIPETLTTNERSHDARRMFAASSAVSGDRRGGRAACGAAAQFHKDISDTRKQIEFRTMKGALDGKSLRSA